MPAGTLPAVDMRWQVSIGSNMPGNIPAVRGLLGDMLRNMRTAVAGRCKCWVLKSMVHSKLPSMACMWTSIPV